MQRSRTPYKKSRRDIPGLCPGIPGNLGSLAKSVSQQRFTRDSETEEIDSCGSTPGVLAIRSVHRGQPGIFRKRGFGPKLTDLKALMQSRTRPRTNSTPSPPGHPNRAHSELFEVHAAGCTGRGGCCQALSVPLRLCTAAARPAPCCGKALTGAQPPCSGLRARLAATRLHSLPLLTVPPRPFHPPHPHRDGLRQRAPHTVGHSNASCIWWRVPDTERYQILSCGCTQKTCGLWKANSFHNEEPRVRHGRPSKHL